MDYKKIQYYLSKPRMSRFLSATKGDATLAYQLYLDNLCLAQAFHPLLGMLEVTLRNALNEQLSAYFNDHDWIMRQKSGFMSDKQLQRYDPRQRKMVQNTYLRDLVAQAEQSVRRLRQPVTSGKVIAELTLGFWTSLFDKTEYKILKGQPIQIFTQLPPRTGRAQISTALNEIRAMRNRMNHNEPLCFNGSHYDCRSAGIVYQSITEIVTWMDQEILTWLADVDQVKDQIRAMDGKYL